MKAKRVIAMLSVLGMLGMFAAGAQGAEAWYTCTVYMTGQGIGSVYVKLVDTAGSPAWTGAKWCVGSTTSDTQANRLLAIALTAVNGDFQVYVKMDKTLTTPVIQSFYLMSPI